MRLLVAAWAGMGNTGDDWLLETAVSELSTAHVVGVLLEPYARATTPALAAALALHWPRLSPSPAAAPAVSTFRRALSEWDGVIFAGGGWLAGDQGARSVLRWRVRTRMLNRPYVLAGIGVGPFPGHVGATIAANVLTRARAVTVRTAMDATIARDLTGNLPAVVGDLTTRGHQVAPSSPRQGVVIAAPQPRRHWLPEHRVDDYRDAFLSCAHRMSKGEPVMQVSFQTPQDSAFWRPHVRVVEPQSPRDALEHVARARVVIAGRLHAGLAACSTSTSLVSVAYHHKAAVLEEMFAVKSVEVASFLTNHEAVTATLPSALPEARPGSDLLSLAECLR